MQICYGLVSLSICTLASHISLPLSYVNRELSPQPLEVLCLCSVLVPVVVLALSQQVMSLLPAVQARLSRSLMELW